jgi:hypothetical protein
MFSEFQNTEGDCAGNTAAVAVTVMLSLVVTMASVHPNIREAQVRITRRAHTYFPVHRAGVNTVHLSQGGSSGLFQSSILTAYAMYLVASGILSTPLSGPARGGEAPLPFPIEENRPCVVLLYGRAGCLTATNGGFRRGQ